MTIAGAAPPPFRLQLLRQSFKLKKFNLNKSHVRICAQITLKKIQFRAGWQSSAGEQVPHNSHPSAPSFVMLMAPLMALELIDVRCARSLASAASSSSRNCWPAERKAATAAIEKFRTRSDADLTAVYLHERLLEICTRGRDRPFDCRLLTGCGSAKGLRGNTIMGDDASRKFS